MPGFNPGAGGKIVNNPARPGAFQAGGIGLDAAKLLNTPSLEIRNYYRERFSRDGSQEVTVRMGVPWSERKTFVDWILGYSTSIPIPGSTQTLLTRQIPYQCPEVGYEHLYANECNLIEPQGVFGQAGIVPNDPNGQPILVAQQGGGQVAGVADWPAWYSDKVAGSSDGTAEYEVVFRPMPGSLAVRTDAQVAAIQNGQGELERYVEREKRSSLQGLPIPGGLFKFTNKVFGGGVAANPGDPIPTSAAFLLMPQQELHYIWHEVPDEPRDAIGQCQGKVNTNPFDGAKGWPTYPQATLLCQAPPEVKAYRHTTGRLYWRIRYAFLYRKQGWNYYPDKKGQFVLVTSDGNDDNQNGIVRGMYEGADLNTLFQAPAPVVYQ